jgi:glycerol-3-phosphate acyltransferase PlsY
VSFEGILLVIGGYFVGSIPTGIILAKLSSTKDIRQEGSGNIGATNVYRVLGAKLAVLTLIGDIAKGAIPVILARYLLGNDMWIAGVAFPTFLGHIFPIFLKFRGGKGVATALGIILVIAPLMAPCMIIIFALVVMKWKHVSLGSLTASALMPIFLCLAGYPIIYVNLSLVMGCLIFYRHWDNIKRLREGREKKVSKARS